MARNARMAAGLRPSRSYVSKRSRPAHRRYTGATGRLWTPCGLVQLALCDANSIRNPASSLHAAVESHLLRGRTRAARDTSAVRRGGVDASRASGLRTEAQNVAPEFEGTRPR